MPSTKPNDPEGPALARRHVGQRERPQQHEPAGQQQGAADGQQHERVEVVAPRVAQPVEQPDAGQRRRARPDREPERHPREHGPLREVPVAADRLRDRRVGEVGADGDHRLDADHEDQQRRHQRAAAHAGDADEDAHAEAEEDDRRIHQEAGRCRPHSILSVPAQRPSRPPPGEVQWVQPIEA
jgi:hypothetical protein